jgi:outer membrane protein assembly factor BamA
MKTAPLFRILPVAAALAGGVPALAALAPVPAMAQTGSYTLNKVTFEGNSAVSADELRAALPIQVGDKIDQAGLQQNINAVAQTYQKHNVGVKITQRMTVFHKTKADIAYVLQEQAPVAPTVQHVGITVDHVTVTGNKKIPTATILAAANIKPGDQVNNEKIQAAQNAISGLYKKANIGSNVSTDWTNTSPQHVDMVFKVEEKSDE